MSMLSEQVKELRTLAGDGSMEWTRPIRASVLLDAADTIARLRSRLELIELRMPRAVAGIIESQEPAYREENEIDVLTRRVMELEKERDQCRDSALYWQRMYEQQIGVRR